MITKFSIIIFQNCINIKRTPVFDKDVDPEKDLKNYKLGLRLFRTLE